LRRRPELLEAFVYPRVPEQLGDSMLVRLLVQLVVGANLASGIVRGQPQPPPLEPAGSSTAAAASSARLVTATSLLEAHVPPAVGSGALQLRVHGEGMLFVGGTFVGAVARADIFGDDSKLRLKSDDLSSTTVRVGKSAAAQAATISAGVALVPLGQDRRWIIDVEPGVYRERVWVNASIGPLTMRGLSASEDAVLLIYHCCPAGDGTPGCSNATADKACAPQHVGAGMSRGVETLLIEAADFMLLNISVANDACGYDSEKAAQSETVQLLADRIAFRHTRLYGAQDTVFAGGEPGNRQYFLQSFVNGSCDAIFGTSSMVWHDSRIAITDHITAHRGDEFMWNAARGRRSNYIFYNCSLVKPTNGTAAYPAKNGGTELGRPWGAMAAVVYHNCWMDSHIAKYGWGDWGHACDSGPGGGEGCTPTLEASGSITEGNSSCWCQNTTYVEYGSYGPGASPSTRKRWAFTVTAAEDHPGGILGALGLAGALPRDAMGTWVPPFADPPVESTWPSPWLPAWEPTYSMSRSTVMQPCNYSGPLEPLFASRFGLVDTDWANNLKSWSNAQPMNSEEKMVEQAAALKQLNPKSKQFVYRNLVQAYSWFGGSVREKLEDPLYSGFFLRFRPKDKVATHSPRCDDAYDPPLCSELYHSQSLAPNSKEETCFNFSTCDGFCESGKCDCGKVPCGSYVFDHRNGSMLRDWLVDEFVGGRAGVGAPNGIVDGMFFDGKRRAINFQCLSLLFHCLSVPKTATVLDR
jgi:pectinesterase